MSVLSDTDTDAWFPDFVIVGPQKCATTWMYEGLAEHPDVYMPETDSVHYFDMAYHRDIQWYREHFPSDPENYEVIGEETPSYIRSEVTPERLATFNPDIKVIISLRNPIERAFSHYWHEKSKGKISFEFEEVFENYDLYENWIRPGMYADHIQRFESELDRDQINLMYFDDLVEDDESYIREIYDFVGVNPSFTPSIIDERVNDARWSSGIEIIDKVYYRSVNFAYRRASESIKQYLRPVHEFIQDGGLSNPFKSESEYERGMDSETRRRLETIYLEKTKELEDLTDRSFEHWFNHIEY